MYAALFIYLHTCLFVHLLEYLILIVLLSTKSIFRMMTINKWIWCFVACHLKKKRQIQTGFALLGLFIYIIWVHISNIFASKIVNYMTENIQRPALQAFLPLVHWYGTSEEKKKDNNQKKTTFSLRLLHTLSPIQYKDIWHNHGVIASSSCVWQTMKFHHRIPLIFFFVCLFLFIGWCNGHGHDQNVFFSTQVTKINGSEFCDKRQPLYDNLKCVFACFVC